MRLLSKVGAGRQVELAIVTVALVVVGLYSWVLADPRRTGSWDQWLALLLAPALVAAAVPLGRRLARASGDPRMTALVVAAAAVKVVGTGVRYFVSYGVYGYSDATGYINRGAQYADQLWNGYLVLPDGRLVGTAFLDLVTGAVFAVTRPAPLVGYLVFSAAGFLGLYHYARAFVAAVPTARAMQYGILVFFTPSLLYWPSSIGKDSWMLLTLGLATRGAAMVFARERGAVLFVAIGVTGAAMVRPHVALLIIMALGFARLASGDGVRPQPAVQRVLTLAVIVAIGAAVLGQAERYFNVEEESFADAATAALDTAADRTAQGGSHFEGRAVRSPLDLPQAILTVLFRPWPHEAHNAQALIASLEGVALFGLCLWRRHSLARIPTLIRSHPFVLMAVLYCLMFVVAFSTFGNFGIITRQRVQVYPLFLALLCLTETRPRQAVSSRGWRRRDSLPRAS